MADWKCLRKINLSLTYHKKRQNKRFSSQQIDWLTDFLSVFQQTNQENYLIPLFQSLSVQSPADQKAQELRVRAFVERNVARANVNSLARFVQVILISYLF